MADKLLTGKTALITGTNRGIEKAILRKYAENGASIWAHAGKETPEFLTELEMLSENNGVTIRPLCFELTDRCIAPGITDTEMLETMPQWAVEDSVSKTCLKRPDIAQAAVFLASDKAGYITGQVLCVDGGLTQ